MTHRSALRPLSDRSEARRSARLAETLARRSTAEFSSLASVAARRRAEEADRLAASRRVALDEVRPATEREVSRALALVDEAVADARSDFPEVGDVDLVPEILRGVSFDLRAPVAREVRRILLGR